MKWLNDNSRNFLQAGYLTEGETAEQRIRDIAEKAESYLQIDGFAEKFYKYMESGFYSLASPIWANYGRKRGLPISCFGSHISDSTGSILETLSEIGMMSKMGGGTSAYFGELRPRGSAISNVGESSGVVHFIEMYDKLIDTISQGGVRRGQMASYLPIDHGDIHEFLEIGSESSEIHKTKTGVCVPDKWMEEMIAGDEEKRVVWAKVIKSRVEIGYPYIFFTDNVNNNKPDCYKDMEITHSNLCSEVTLFNNKNESFVCCLSSMNLNEYDKWKDTDAVETLVYFLDTVITEFCEKLIDFGISQKNEDSKEVEHDETAHTNLQKNTEPLD